MNFRSDKEKKYDVFISYRSLNRKWVEILARNLVSSGFEVFLDVWSLVAGQAFAEGLWKGLDRSRKGVLVATREAVESGWVRAEYEEMLDRSRRIPGFTFVPIVFGEIPELPFLNNVQCVDFRVNSSSEYLHAFHRLVTGLKDVPPGQKDANYLGIVIPEPIDPLFVGPVVMTSPPDFSSVKIAEFVLLDQIFGALDVAPIVVTLGQSYRKDHNYLIEGIKSRACSSYSNDSVLHIAPPYSEDVRSEQYVGRLSEQCNLSKIAKGWFEWESILDKRLRGGERIFMLVSEFEHGSQDGRRQLAGVIRGLVQQHSPRFKVVLLGGERLGELKYDEGAMSLLNMAKQLDWPESSVGDVLMWQMRDFPELILDEKGAGEILKLCGGHPWLVHYCLQYIQSNGSMDGAFEKLVNDNFLWQMFTPYRKSPEDCKRICKWLETDDLGPVQPWPYDSLLRHLYWNNLLESSSGRYRWRCEIVREVGRQALACLSASMGRSPG